MAGRRKKSEETPELAAGDDAPALPTESASPEPGTDHPATALPEPDVAPPADPPDLHAGGSQQDVPDSESTPETEQPPAPRPPEDVPPARSGNPLLLVLGGVVAAFFGFALAQVVPNGWPLEATGRQLSEFDARLTAQDRKLSEFAPDSELAERLATLEARLAGLADPQDGIEALRIELENLKQSIGAPGPELDALKAEVADLRNELAAVPREASQELEALRAAAQAEREAAEARTAALRADAEATARSAVARGAVLRIQAALDAGGAFDAALGDLALAGVDVPAALATHAQGVPTMARLQADFPDAARAALAAAHAPDADAPLTQRLGSFLKAQTGMRSVTPRDGDEPDAILSRAEAALSKADLAATLAELDTLPSEAAVSMADWRMQADARAQAGAALATLAAELNAN